MRWSNSDPLGDWAAVPSGLTPVFALPLLEPFCRDWLPVAEGGALLPFRAGKNCVAGTFFYSTDESVAVLSPLISVEELWPCGCYV
jgi:hypothetical protein